MKFKTKFKTIETTIETTEDFIERMLRTYEFGFSHGLDKHFKINVLHFVKQLEEKCNTCIFSYHNKNSKGYHDVEEFYQE